MRGLIEAVNEISAMSEFRSPVRKLYCNLERRLKLRIPMFEEIKESRDLLSEDASKSLTALKEALNSAKELLCFGTEGSKIYLVGSKMDFSESTRVVFNRIKKLEPDNATKIIGCLLLQEHSDQEIDKLASCPDMVLQDVICKAKADLCQFQLASKLPPSPMISPSVASDGASTFPPPFSPGSPGSFFPPMHPFRVPSSLYHRQAGFLPSGYQDSDDQVQVDPVGFGFVGDYIFPDAALGSSVGPRAGRWYPCLNEFPVKTCHYFNKGYCKHGSSCRYFHGQCSERFPHPGLESISDDHIFSTGSLEKLEMEIIELLKSRKGHPVSIASLPMMYYDKYGKVLQAEGYLTESQRHGKAGYSLTKLLARLKHSIRLIDRPHGQHAVILAEDAYKYMESRGDLNDPGPIVSGSRQIYLTFPAESTFSEDDVSNYFSTFGLVEDVRLPCLQKRMFGFVTFESSDTVKMILAKGNPHYICGARVLVKPYREKTRLVDRRYHERVDPVMRYPSHFMDMEDELHSMPRRYETSRLLRNQLIEEQERALEAERRRLAELHSQIARNPRADRSYYAFTLDDLNVSEDDLDLASAERFSHLLDVLSIASAGDDKIRFMESYTDEDSQVINLPENPFTSPMESGISTVI